MKEPRAVCVGLEVDQLATRSCALMRAPGETGLPPNHGATLAMRLSRLQTARDGLRAPPGIRGLGRLPGYLPFGNSISSLPARIE